jgi:hypothetical protein
MNRLERVTAQAEIHPNGTSGGWAATRASSTFLSGPDTGGVAYNDRSEAVAQLEETNQRLRQILTALQDS